MEYEKQKLSCKGAEAQRFRQEKLFLGWILKSKSAHAKAQKRKVSAKKSFFLVGYEKQKLSRKGAETQSFCQEKLFLGWSMKSKSAHAKTQRCKGSAEKNFCWCCVAWSSSHKKPGESYD